MKATTDQIEFAPQPDAAPNGAGARNGAAAHKAPTPRLADRLAAVLRRTGPVARNGRHEADFLFFTAPDVFDHIRRQLFAAGVLVDHQIAAVSDTRVGGKPARTVRGALSFRDTETEEVITVKTAGRAACPGGEGLAAARTGALKHSLKKNFLIVDEEGCDPDEAREGCSTAPAAEPGKRKRGRKRASSLFGKLREVVALGARIERSGANELEGYTFTTETDVLAVVRPALVARSVLLLTSVEGLEETPDGGALLTRVRTSHTFIDAESGQSLALESAGESWDLDDKGVYRAVTAAFKYALLEFLLQANTAPASPLAAMGAAALKRWGLSPGDIAAFRGGKWKEMVAPVGAFAGKRLDQIQPQELQFGLKTWAPARPPAGDRTPFASTVPGRFAAALVAWAIEFRP